MVLPCLLALLALPTPALALAAFLASLLPAALLGTSLGQQVDFVFFGVGQTAEYISFSLFFFKYLTVLNAGCPSSPSNCVALH